MHRIGEVVRIVNNTSGHNYPIGSEVEITEMRDGIYRGRVRSTGFYGNNFNDRDIEALPKSTELLTKFQEMFLDEDVKDLIKAGILSKSLELTDEGRDMLLARYLLENKEDIIAEARKLLAERSKTKKPSKK